MYSVYVKSLFDQIKKKKDRIRYFQIFTVGVSILLWLGTFIPVFLNMKPGLSSILLIIPFSMFFLAGYISFFLFTFSILINGIYYVYKPIKNIFETSETTNFENIIFSLVSACDYLEEISKLEEKYQEHNKQMAIVNIRTVISKIDRLIRFQLRSEYFEPIRNSLRVYQTQLRKVISIINNSPESYTSVEYFLAKSVEIIYEREYKFDYTALKNFEGIKVQEDIAKQLINEVNQLLSFFITVKFAVRILMSLILSALITLPAYYIVSSSNIDPTLAGLFIGIFAIPLTFLLTFLTTPTSLK